MADPPTTPAAKPKPIPLAAQIREVEREIGMRGHVFEARVADKRMSREEADYRINCMKAVHATLTKLAGGGQRELFGEEANRA